MKKLFFKSIYLLITTVVITSCQKEKETDVDTGDTSVGNLANYTTTIETPCGSAIPDSLQVPAGNKLVLQTYAKGVQIYEVKQSVIDPTSYSWVNIAPSATLYAKPDFTNQLALHYAGPTWEFTKGQYKGEKVVASKLKASTQNTTAIPWLLLKAVDSLSSAGNKITYIQRVCTTGGLAPSIPATAGNAGSKDSIQYTAAYLFYTKS